MLDSGLWAGLWTQKIMYLMEYGLGAGYHYKFSHSFSSFSRWGTVSKALLMSKNTVETAAHVKSLETAMCNRQ